MTTFLRWMKFNLVGAIGMLLQLAALALISKAFPTHYLLASAAAIEITLLHNFVWHLHYTWRDRRDNTPVPSKLLRFHLTNGLVSMLGNLALMRVLILTAHLPLLAANSIAILCCSILNFCLGDLWAFARTPQLPQTEHRTSLTPPLLEPSPATSLSSPPLLEVQLHSQTRKSPHPSVKTAQSPCTNH